MMKPTLKLSMCFLAGVAMGGCMTEELTSEADQQDQSELLPKHVSHVRTEAKTHGGGGGNGIYYHGGPVMHGNVPVYFIWYGNWSGNSATTLLPALIGDLSGSSYEHINTTYTDGSGPVAGTMTLSGQVNDNYSKGSSLSDTDIQSVVAAHCGNLGNCDTSALYFVLTSSDVTASSGFCTQ